MVAIGVEAEAARGGSSPPAITPAAGAGVPARAVALLPDAGVEAAGGPGPVDRAEAAPAPDPGPPPVPVARLDGVPSAAAQIPAGEAGGGSGPSWGS